MADHEESYELPPLPSSQDDNVQPAFTVGPSQGLLGGGDQVLASPETEPPGPYGQRYSQTDRQRLVPTGNQGDRSSERHSTPSPHPQVGTPAIWAHGGSASSIPGQNVRVSLSPNNQPVDTRPPLTTLPTQYEAPDPNAIAAFDVPIRPPLARTITNGHVSVPAPLAVPMRDPGITDGHGQPFAPNGTSRHVSLRGAPVQRGPGYSFNGTRDGYGNPYNLEQRTTGGIIDLPLSAVQGDNGENAHRPNLASRALSMVKGAASIARDSVMSRADRAALEAAQDARIQLLLFAVLAEKRKCELKVKFTSYALNIAIGLQVLLGALTTALSVATTGKQTSIMTATLGGITTVVASYLARARGTGEPEVSIDRLRDLEQFVRECTALDLDAHREGGNPMVINVRIDDLRDRFEGMLGNTTDRRVSSPQSRPAPPPPHPSPLLMKNHTSSTQNDSVPSQYYIPSSQHHPSAPQNYAPVPQNQTLAPQNNNSPLGNNIWVPQSSIPVSQINLSAPQSNTPAHQHYPSTFQNYPSMPQDHM